MRGQLSRRRSLARLVGVGSGEGIIGLQGMRAAAAGFQDVGDRAGAESVLGEGLGHGGVEFRRAIIVEQRQQADHVRA